MMKQFISAAIAMATVAGAMAAVNPDEFVDLEFDKDYQLTQYSSFKGKITPAESGIVIEYGTVPVYTLDDQGELQAVEDWEYAGYINSKQAYQFTATAGTTYYVYSGFVMDNGSFRLSLNPEVKILESIPAEGGILDIAADEFASIVVNQNITIGKATLSSGMASADISTRALGSSVSLLVRETMLQWYEDGTVAGGEELTITLSDVKDAIGNDADDIVLHFIAAAAPYKLVDTRIPETILSYYPAGSEDAKVVFTFSGPMGTNPDIQLCYSPIELGYEYYEKLPASVDGNRIIVDLSGKLRSPEIMSPTGLNQSTIDLRLFGIRDARGQLVLASEGSLGSFHFQTGYSAIPKVTFAPQFTPAYGADLTDETEVSVTFDNGSELAYSGMYFMSGTDRVSIPQADLTVTDKSVTARIPEGWNTRKDVYVGLENMSCTDGYDHSREFTVKYNGFALTFVNPAADSSLASLAKGRTISIDTNLKTGDEVTFALYDGDDVIYGPKLMTDRTEGQYLHAMESQVTLYSTGSYTMRFTSGNSTETVAIKGISAEFEYSPNELESVTPAEGSAIESGSVITLTFTGMVKIEKVSGSADFMAAPATDDAVEGYDTTWALTLSEVTEEDIAVSFRAVDFDALLVKGNEGDEATTCFTLHYNLLSGIASVTVEANGQTIIHDLSGRRHQHPVRGINIINGHKVLVK